MNVNIKQKLAGKSAYIALAILLIAILVFTVIAIIATVNAEDEEALPPVNEGEEAVPGGETEGEGNATTGGDVSDPTVPGESETVLPEPVIYGTPCSGAVQKDFCSDSLVFSQTMNDHRVHLGIDISGNVGDPVKSFGKGIVEKIYHDTFMGKTVVIDHGSGLKSVYMNLAETLPQGITVGVAVDVGTVIGAIGETAMNECADSPHLHFEILLDSKRVDPRSYITLPSSAESEDVYEG